MIPYKLICSDIDGTLLNKERQLSNRTINAVKSLNHLVPFILISSRMPKAMRHLQTELDIKQQPLIAYNGGLVIHYEKDHVVPLLSKEVPMAITERLLAFISKSTIHTSLYHADEWYVPAMDYWAKREQHNTKVDPTVADLNGVCTSWASQNKGAHKIMCMGEAGDIQLLENWINSQHADALHAYRSKPTYLEISSKQISKLSALSFLLGEKFDLPLTEVVAFGDNYNDVEMLDGVGFGVAVGNAKAEVKAVANRIGLSNLEDGVAVVLEDLFRV